MRDICKHSWFHRALTLDTLIVFHSDGSKPGIGLIRKPSSRQGLRLDRAIVGL